jgi:hypothetical protein
MLHLDLKTSTGQHVAAARFDAPEDFAAFLAGPVAAAACDHWTEDNGEFHGATARETLERAQRGDLERVALSDAMLARLEDAIGFEARRWRTVDSVAGGAPNVAAFLAGSPMSMRRRVRMLDAAAPLTIAIEVGVSASVDAASIARRGAAALALARIAAGQRPVTLWAYSAAQNANGKNAAYAVRIETAPLDTSRAAWILCAPESCRRASFATCSSLARWSKANTSVRWLDKHDEAVASILPALTGAGDLVSVAGLNTAAGKQAFKTDEAAAAWVQSMLATHGAVERA